MKIFRLNALLEIRYSPTRVISNSVALDQTVWAYCKQGVPISYRFGNKRRFRSKLAKFSYTLILRGFPWNFVKAVGFKKSFRRSREFEDLIIRLDTIPQCRGKIDRRTHERWYEEADYVQIQVTWPKYQNLKIQDGGRPPISKMVSSLYLSCRSSDFNEI